MRLSRFLRTSVAIAAVLFFKLAIAQQVADPLPINQPIQDKDFFLFSVLERDTAVRSAIAADKELEQIASERRDTLASAQKTCKQDAVCTVKAFLWTDEEIRAVSLALDRLATNNRSVRTIVENKLRPSYAYILFAKQPPGQLLANAWETCARGLNDILEVYGEGLPPRYPSIDSISIDVKSAEVQQHLASLLAEQSSTDIAAQAFFAPSLKVALELLTLNHRDEAGRHEPMETGINATALRAISAAKWQDYPYSVIVVPGAGPSAPNIALSEAGRRRCALAAEAYRAGKAPFILVSGGYVHPSQTQFSEAIEMKKALVQDFQIPESAIVIDPHARHTTTNMRDAAREMFRYHMPANKPALVVSDASQIAYIASQTFADRCLRELGYMPYRLVGRNSDTEIVFVPLIESLQQDPMDPLDP